MLLLQTSKNKFLAIIAVSLVTVFALAFFSPHAYALTLSPARIEINGDPGATVGGEFTIINEQSTTQTFYASYENFSAQGETGAPAFSPEKIGLDTWLHVTPEQLTIAPGQAVPVPYAITIPKNAEPGGYFAAIFWSNSPPATSSTQVSIGAKVGLLILLRVNGNITESAGISQFDRNDHSFFYTTLPVTMRYKFRNNGSDRIEPLGTVTIRNTLFIPSVKLDANAVQGNILPGSTRQFTLRWLKREASLPIQGFFNNVSYEWQNFAVGLYSAHLNLAYGNQGLHTTKTVWFFVFPWQLLICIVLILIIVWWGGKTILTRYNRYIIKQAQAGIKKHDIANS